MTKIEVVLTDKSTSYWLRESLKSAMSRDPIDAVNDAETLLCLLNECANSILESNQQTL